MRILLRAAGASLLFLLLSARSAFAGDFFETDGVALHGYDPVSYFESAEPVKGVASHSFTYHGSKFLFASAEHLRVFRADPEKYSPQFGGFCAYGAANGYKVSTQPDAYEIVDGKLYLNHDLKVLGIWKQDKASNIHRAETNWPEVSHKPLLK